MYSLVSAYGVSSQPNSRWVSADVAAIPMNQLYRLYRSLYLTLSSTFLVDPINVDFEIFRAQYGNESKTVEEFLTDLGNTSLVTVPNVPQYQTKRIEYSDGFRAGYKIDITTPGSIPINNATRGDRTEVRISRPNTDMQSFYDNCLVSINGFFHKTETDGVHCYVPDGGKSLLKSRQNQLGFINFKPIGKIECVPIIEAMVYKQNENSFLKHNAYIEIGRNLTNKTLMVVIGGYLYLPGNNSLKLINDNVVMIDFNHVPIVERYFEALKYIDMSSLGLPVNVASPDQINIGDFFKDEHFIKYLTMKQSFLVILDTPQIYTQRNYIRHNDMPGIFIAYEEPKYPLITSTGKVSEYWKQHDDGHWCVNVHDAYKFNRVSNSVAVENLYSATDNSLPYRTYYNSQGYFLEIGSDKLIP